MEQRDGVGKTREQDIKYRLHGCMALVCMHGESVVRIVMRVARSLSGLTKDRLAGTSGRGLYHNGDPLRSHAGFLKVDVAITPSGGLDDWA